MLFGSGYLAFSHGQMVSIDLLDPLLCALLRDVPCICRMAEVLKIVRNTCESCLEPAASLHENHSIHVRTLESIKDTKPH